MEMYKFIAWADIHWDKLGAKCITLDDTDQVERAIFERAKSGKFDFTLFPGDRYLKREPCDETKVRADRVIEDYVHNGVIPHYHLIGNHDWVDNATRWHTSESMKRYNNVHIMDEAKTYRYKNVCIHALPADFPMDKSKYLINPECFNLFVFHDALRGSFLDEGLTQPYEGGIPPSEIDLPEFDLVLAGDIHIRQKFNLKNTRGGYLGSALQRTKADSNAKRGFTEFTISRKNPNMPWEVDEKFVPVRNYFTRVSFNVDPETLPSDLKIPSDEITDQLVEVRLNGEKADVDRVADHPHWANLAKVNGARKLDILRGYSAQRYESVCVIERGMSVAQDIERYLESDFANIGKNSKADIIGKVNEMRGI